MVSIHPMACFIYTKIAIDLQQDSSQVDFRNPESFYHDVNSVAGLLKQFFRDLPDPLLTREHYQAFIEAARMYLRPNSYHIFQLTKSS